jgi:predicted dehydrogenase
MDRREFLRATTAGLALTAAGSHVPLYAQAKPRRVGLIGSGWYGKSAHFRLLQVEPVEVVAVCDVDKKMLAEAASMIAARQKSGKTPRTYGDYREMLKQEQLDIVHIATPDHWHALPMIAACKAGADVYVEKPVSVDVVEAHAMLAAARKYNRVVQVNMQRRSTPHLVEAKERVIKEGKLGKVAYVEICCYYHMRNRSNPADMAPPEHLDYEMWTGPAPMRPYTPINHPRGWRAFMEYGNGIVGDMCVHMLDTVRWMLGLGWPRRISSSGGIYVQKEGKSNISDTQAAVFEYDGLNVVWQHRTWGAPTDPKYPWGLFLYGDKGTLKASTMSYDFVPHGSGEPIHKDCIELNAAPATRLHMLDFLAAIEKRSRPVADIEEGHISTASCILANLAMQVERPLVYDPKTRQVAGDADATRLLRRPYREPWQHPGATL